MPTKNARRLDFVSGYRKKPNWQTQFKLWEIIGKEKPSGTAVLLEDLKLNSSHKGNEILKQWQTFHQLQRIKTDWRTALLPIDIKAMDYSLVKRKEKHKVITQENF